MNWKSTQLSAKSDDPRDEELIWVRLIHAIRCQPGISDSITPSTPMLTVPVRILNSGLGEESFFAERLPAIRLRGTAYLFENVLFIHSDS